MIKSAKWLLFLTAFTTSIGLGSEVYFSPDGGARDQVIRRINLSESSIDIAMYSFTSGEIAAALANASKRGVKIRIIRDKLQSSGRSDENNYLKKANIQVQIRSGKGRGIMHNKFAVFDHKEIFSGSFNWTDNAERNNYENALFTNDHNLVSSYDKEFQKIWSMPVDHSNKNIHRKTPGF